MPAPDGHRCELGTLPVEVARKLVDTLYHQTTSLVVGALVSVSLGLIGFVGTGSRWYICGVLMSACVGMYRLAGCHLYKRKRDTRTPLVWANRFAWGAWAAGLIWGAWSTVILYETEMTFTLTV